MKTKRIVSLMLVMVFIIGMGTFAVQAASDSAAAAAPPSPQTEMEGTGGTGTSEAPPPPQDDDSPAGAQDEPDTPDVPPPPEVTSDPVPVPADTSTPAPTAEPVPTEEPKPTPEATEVPEVPPAVSPETGEPAADEPSIVEPGMGDPTMDEPWGEGIFYGPDDPDGPLMISASSGSATITVRSCYDASGSQIKYVNTFYYDGRYTGAYGTDRHIVYADGEPAYCLEPGKYLMGGNVVTTSAASVWAGLGSEKQNAIKLAILCGAEGNASNLSGVYGSQYTATQMVIWEFIVGVRSTSAPYTVSDSKVINSVCKDGANPEVKTIYDEIATTMATYNTIPSFASGPNVPTATRTLEYKNGTYTLTLTDSNKVLGNYKVTCTNSSVKLSVSGNKLTITSSVPITGATLNFTRKNVLSASGTITAYAGQDLQETIVGVEEVGNPTAKLGIVTDAAPTPTPTPTPVPTPTPTPPGNVRIVKTCEDGNIAGIRFHITGLDNNVDQYATTGSDGTIIVYGLEPGRYMVTEIVPDGYTVFRNDQTVWIDSWRTVTVDFSNRVIKSSLQIIKTASDFNVSGITFTVSGPDFYQTVTTGPDGTITISDLSPGTYTITEAVPYGYAADRESQTITIMPGEAATVRFHNTPEVGGLRIIKTSADGNVAGIQFRVEGNGIDQTVTTEADGTITVPGLITGEYTVTEIVPEGYVCDEPSQSVFVLPNNAVAVNFENRLKEWRVTVTKVDADAGAKRSSGVTLAGAQYGVYHNGTLQDTYTTDESGHFTTDYYPCGTGWTLQEISAPTGYTVDPTSYPIGLEPGTAQLAANDTELTVPEQIIKGKLVIVKQEGSTKTPLAGATFQVLDETGAVVTEGTTGEDGTFTVESLAYGSYTAKETKAPDGYQLDETVSDFSITEEGQEVRLTRENIYATGSITVHKVDTQGDDLAGTTYLLEWSEDGSTWVPVTFRSDTTPTIGGCTSLGLTDGQLTTGEDGLARFDGLVANGNVQYRLTETATTPGLSLLAESVFQGALPLDGEADIAYTVTNNRITELPQTGGSGLLLPVTIGTALLGLAMCAGVIMITKNNKKENN